MLKPYQIVNVDKLAIIARYELNDLMIFASESDANKYDIFECNHYEYTYEYLMTLSIPELRYLAGYSVALLDAIKQHYNDRECSVTEITRIGIPTKIDFAELETSIKIAMGQAMADHLGDNDELLDAYQDICDMTNHTLQIFRTINKMQALRKGDN